MLTMYFISILISYVLLREGFKKQVKTNNTVVFEEILILIVSLLIPVFNLLISLGMFFDFYKGKNSSATIIERFFLLKK